MRSRDLSQDDRTTVTIEALVEGEHVDGIIKKVEVYGLFIEIKGTKISGLCHKSEVRIFFKVSHILPLTLFCQRQLSDNKKSDVSRALKLFKEGDSVRARILRVDVERRRVNFGLKPSYFVDDPAAITAASDDVSESAENDDGSDPAEDDEDDQGGDDDEMKEGQGDALLADAAGDENTESEDADDDVWKL
jgi:rRNA biogenesis protein RRP5